MLSIHRVCCVCFSIHSIHVSAAHGPDIFQFDQSDVKSIIHRLKYLVADKGLDQSVLCAGREAMPFKAFCRKMCEITDGELADHDLITLGRHYQVRYDVNIRYGMTSLSGTVMVWRHYQVRYDVIIRYGMTSLSGMVWRHYQVRYDVIIRYGMTSISGTVW